MRCWQCCCSPLALRAQLLRLGLPVRQLRCQACKRMQRVVCSGEHGLLLLAVQHASKGPHTMLQQLQALGKREVLPRAEGVLGRAAALWTALLRCCWRLHPSLLRASMACGATWVQLYTSWRFNSSSTIPIAMAFVVVRVWLMRALKIVHTFSTPLLRCPGGEPRLHRAACSPVTTTSILHKSVLIASAQMSRARS